MVARASPIRDKIGAFLSEPRAAREVAEHIERTVPIATGHLAAMCRLGLAQRLGHNAYAAAHYNGPVVRFKRVRKHNSLRRQLRPLLSSRSSLIGLKCKTGKPIEEIRAVLREMWLSGAVVGDETSGFMLKGATR